MDLYVLRLAEDGAAVRNGKMRVCAAVNEDTYSDLIILEPT